MKVLKNCGHCKRDFLFDVRPSEPHRGRFCSHRCADSSRAKTIDERFKAKVGERTANGCDPWVGAKNRNDGYGIIWVSTKCKENAHRVAYELFIGPIPEGMWVLHTCDNPSCVNPSHLFLGTARDNSDDMVAKNRHVHGNKSPHAKLDDDKAAAIVGMREDGATQEDIAKHFGVSRRTVGLILNGRRWRNVTRC